MKNIKWLLIVFWSLEIGFSPLQALAQAVPDSAFNPGLIIPDEAFADVGTFGSAAGIQSFLELKGSVLANTTPEFLIKLKEADTLTKVGLEDPQPNLTRLRTAAELIYDAGAKWGLNPQVILVILQKEQSLIAGTFNSDSSLQRALDRSLGFGCPDYEGRGDIFLGFYRQLFGTFDGEGNRWLGAAASLMRSFRAEVGGARVGRGPMVDAQNTTYGRPVVRTARVGDSITLDNTLNGYSGVQQQQTVTLGNYATAALYRYTPHVYNGNYNFWKFYSTWFKYPNGTVIQTAGDARIYIIDNGLKRPISLFVIGERELDPTSVITVSSLEFNEFPRGEVVPPKDGTLLKNSIGQVFLIEAGTRKLLSSFVATQRKLNPASATVVPDDEIQSYTDGGRALPEEGTLVKSKDNPAVYIIINYEKRLLSGFVFKQRGYSFANVRSEEHT